MIRTIGILLALVLPATAQAEQVRYRFVPADANGGMKQVPAGPQGAAGEQLKGLGMRPQPYYRVFRANQMVTLRHPATGRQVMVPMQLPESTPQMQSRSDRVVFNYGAYQVEARFIPDGSVDVVYNAGFLNPLSLE